MSSTTEAGSTKMNNVSLDPKDHILSIGQQRVHVNAITTKVLADISFLQERIDKIKTLKSPNEAILATYQEMLSSRESVLEWLQQHEMIGKQDRTGTA